MLSVVVPAYNEAESLAAFIKTVQDILPRENIPYEIVFVDDGSTDGTWPLIEEASAGNPQIRGVGFSRNFGKEAAIFAGVSEAAGDCCVVLDCDLQHPPEAIVSMYRLWQQGYQVVEGKKTFRGKESVLHKSAANLFYYLISKASGVDMSRASDFKLLDRAAMDALLSLPEQHLFFRAVSSWIGFRTATVDYVVQPSLRDKSHWSSFSLMKYAVRNIAAFSTAPMQIITFLGLAALVLAMGLGIQTIVKWSTGQAMEGFTTVILLLLIIGSLLMVSLGIIGYYIARIYDEVKGRPRYILANRAGTAPPQTPAPGGEVP